MDAFNTDTIHLDRFVNALRPAHETLADLTINATHRCRWYGFERPTIYARGSLTGLRDFTKIKRFKAPFSLLLPHWGSDAMSAEPRRMEDSIPPNVEVVTLSDASVAKVYVYDLDEDLAKLRCWLTETAAATTPHLVEVGLYLEHGYLGDDSSFVTYKQDDTIVEALEGTNVKYNIVEREDGDPWELI